MSKELNQHLEQAEGAQVEPLPYWEPCNPACDPELNGFRDRKCNCAQARAALAQLSPAPEPERPEVVEFDWPEYHYQGMGCDLEDRGITDRYDAMAYGWDSAIEACCHTIPAQHDRIVGALRYKAELYDEVLELVTGKGYMNVTTAIAKLEQERDADQARVAELEAELADSCASAEREELRANGYSQRLAELEKQEPVGYVWPDELSAPRTDPTGFVASRIPHPRMLPIYSAPVAQDGQVPQAWIDVQAERRRQIEEEGWTPEHDDEHDDGKIAEEAASFLMNGQSPQRSAWSWKHKHPDSPTRASRRRQLVIGVALGLAEIERLDRAAAPAQGGSTDE